MHIDRSLRVRDGEVADSNAYNMLMTYMLRSQGNPAAFANWQLVGNLEPGMVGTLDPLTGAFRLYKDAENILNPRVLEFVAPVNWQYQSSGVTRTHEHFNFKGGYKDPSKGVEVKVGLRQKWNFSQSNTIVCCGTRYSIQLIDDPIGFGQKHFDKLHRWAKKEGHGTETGILQGFGVITSTYQALGIMNLASREANQEFEIEGSVDGVGSMSGDGDANASVEGSYKETTIGSNVESFLYPSQPNEAAVGTIPYGFEFMSFDGAIPIPGWVQQVPGINVTFSNWGSYTVDCVATYDTTDAKKQRQQFGLIGWGEQTMRLPVDASNLNVTVQFKHIASWGNPLPLPVIPTPLKIWSRGQATVDITGDWPGDYQVGWRQL